eukprot:2771677-Prymnesium_polylepis.1
MVRPAAGVRKAAHDSVRCSTWGCTPPSQNRNVGHFTFHGYDANGCQSSPPVSYTHLTLPTICSV